MSPPRREHGGRSNEISVGLLRWLDARNAGAAGERGRAVIEGADARHLARSLRARPGEEIEVIDPDGFMLTVRLDSVSTTRVEGVVVAERPHQPEPAARITIAIANLPAPALELVLSRCTEAGAYAFVIFQADRSVGQIGRAHV